MLVLSLGLRSRFEGGGRQMDLYGVFGGCLRWLDINMRVSCNENMLSL